MNAKNEIVGAKNFSSLQDILKWIIILGLFSAGVVANYYFSSYALAFRLLGWLVLMAVITFVVLQTGKGQQLWELIKQARIEMLKVVWPTRQETIQTTLVVVVMVIIMALILWGLDAFLLWAVGFLTGQRG